MRFRVSLRILVCKGRYLLIFGGDIVVCVVIEKSISFGG